MPSLIFQGTLSVCGSRSSSMSLGFDIIFCFFISSYLLISFFSSSFRFLRSFLRLYLNIFHSGDVKKILARSYLVQYSFSWFSSFLASLSFSFFCRILLVYSWVLSLSAFQDFETYFQNSSILFLFLESSTFYFSISLEKKLYMLRQLRLQTKRLLNIIIIMVKIQSRILLEPTAKRVKQIGRCNYLFFNISQGIILQTHLADWFQLSPPPPSLLHLGSRKSKPPEIVHSRMHSLPENLLRMLSSGYYVVACNL